MSRVIAIVGPTAIGKSAVADLLAHQLGTSVISADSMQVYRDMDIGTAKMAPGECLAPLLMVDVADFSVPYSAALYQSAARNLIDEMLEEGKTAILCGGTGLYVRAALDEMRFPAGEAGSSVRDAYEAYAREHGEEALYRLLQDRDPRSAAVIHPHNVRRVLRALEMCDEGTSYADQKQGFSQYRPHYDAVQYGLTGDRRRLYDRIDRRVDEMIARGLIEEVRRLVDKGLGDALTSRQAIGYKEIILYLDGAVSLEEATDLIKMRTRRYAKRQLSWFRRDPRVQWIDCDEMEVTEIVSLIREREGV